MTSKQNALKTLKEITSQPTCPAVVLILVPDKVRRSRVVDAVLKPFVPEISNDYITTYSSQEVKLDTLSNIELEVNSPSLFTKSRFFHFKNIDEVKSDVSKSLLSLLDKDVGEVFFILSGKKLPARSVLKRKCQEAGKLIELPELKGHELTRWAKKELVRVGIEECSSGVVETIVELAGQDPDEIARIAAHLAVYTDSNSLTKEEIFNVFIERPDPNEFELLDIITQGKSIKAELMLSDLLEAGKNPFLLLGLLNRSFTSYYQISQLIGQGMKPTQVRQHLGISPWVFNKHMVATKRYSTKELHNCIQAILYADSKLKNRSLGADLIFSELVSHLAA